MIVGMSVVNKCHWLPALRYCLSCGLSLEVLFDVKQEVNAKLT